MHQISQKIKKAREIRGLTQSDLAKFSGVSLDSIKKYETKAQSNITLENLLKISSVLQVDLNYFAENVPQYFVPQCVQQSAENVPQSKKMSLNNVPQSKILSLNSVVSVVNPPKPHFINIPVYDEVFASAGNGRFNEECVSFYYSVERSLLKSCFKLSNCENLAFLRACGDSMTPTLPPNARLLTQTRTEFKERQIVLARLDDDLFVKRLHKQPHLKLVSDNEKYEPIALAGKDYELIAVIVGFLMSFEN